MSRKKLDFNELPPPGTDQGAELAEQAYKTALELLDSLGLDLDEPEATQTRLPARREPVALCTSLPYKKAVEDQNKPALMQYPEKNPVINSLIVLEKEQTPINYFDLEIEIAVGNLLDRAETSPVFLTAAQIAREYMGLVDNSATISGEMIAAVTESMKKLHDVKAYLEWETQFKQYRRKPKKGLTKYKGLLLEFREIVISAGGVPVRGYQFTKDFLPMHFIHGKLTNALVYAPPECLDTSEKNAENLHGLPAKRSTVRFKLIQRYLWREIDRMIKTKTGARGLLYETIYKNIGEPEPTKIAKQAIDRDIKYCLDLWTRQGVIAGHTAKEKGKRVNKITVREPRQALQLSTE